MLCLYVEILLKSNILIVQYKTIDIRNMTLKKIPFLLL